MTNSFFMGGDCLSLSLDLRAGHLMDVTFMDQGRRLKPLYAAPWAVDDLPDSEPMVVRRLSGDFFCAPFCQPDVEPAPWHGWTANAAWHPIDAAQAGQGDAVYRFELERTVMGARVEKQLRLVNGQPILHERHIFHGGEGALPVAHHTMLRTDTGLKLSFSPKRFGLTPEHGAAEDTEKGASVLAYPQTFTDLSQLRLRTGQTVDATRHPYSAKTEDHIYLFEAPDATIGWSAAVNCAEAYAFFALKDPRILPTTLLWVSNYGLDAFPCAGPFAGKHGACLGVEEICSNLAAGHAASVAANALSNQGIPTAHSLNSEGALVIDYVFGCVAVDPDWREIVAIERDEESITLKDAGGAQRRLAVTLPF
ncbi:hypothetical protein [Asticcacaulis sp. 201]|uniref:hypothetical protein n=1 Tax=Asticcacaulis sp. 201 TaxID=3028787 RepID=UPI0029164A0D|nr:hypothetical protein [Asticcacaulis sp. 201]MDV6330673.1 hypothetical protein [Asticcacaulis sp. 201]